MKRSCGGLLEDGSRNVGKGGVGKVRLFEFVDVERIRQLTFFRDVTHLSCRNKNLS